MFNRIKCFFGRHDYVDFVDFRICLSCKKTQIKMFGLGGLILWVDKPKN